jgi:hypothetical protein
MTISAASIHQEAWLTCVGDGGTAPWGEVEGGPKLECGVLV